jgi:hypothetical protein
MEREENERDRERERERDRERERKRKRDAERKNPYSKSLRKTSTLVLFSQRTNLKLICALWSIVVHQLYSLN